MPENTRGMDRSLDGPQGLLRRQAERVGDRQCGWNYAGRFPILRSRRIHAVPERSVGRLCTARERGYRRASAAARTGTISGTAPAIASASESLKASSEARCAATSAR